MTLPLALRRRLLRDLFPDPVDEPEDAADVDGKPDEEAEAEETARRPDGQ